MGSLEASKMTFLLDVLFTRMTSHAKVRKMTLHKIPDIETVFCPKRKKQVLIYDCWKCEYFRGLKRYYVDCGLWDKLYGEKSCKE